MRRKRKQQPAQGPPAAPTSTGPLKRQRSVATGRQIRFGRALGLLICAGGFAAMGFGWSGTARLSCTDCQIPYLLSGGAVGLGLVIFGVTILVLAQLRAEGRRTAERLDRFEDRVTHLVASSGEVPGSAPSMPVQQRSSEPGQENRGSSIA